MSRPHEHRTKLTIHVLPATAKRIAYLADKKKREHSTLGRVVDAQFGVRASENVADVARAGVGGGVPHQRAKQRSTRAKAQNVGDERREAETVTEAADFMTTETNPNEQDSRSLHAVLGDTAAAAAVALLDMQRALMWMEHENRLAEREEGLGGWLSDHSEAMRYWNAEYDKARSGVPPNGGDQRPRP